MPNNGPDQALVFQFESDYEHLFNQMVSRLRDTVRIKTGQVGTMTAFGFLGASEVSELTGIRHGTTSWHDSPSYRRWVVKADYQDAQILDQEDSLEMLVDLEMGYAQNSAAAMNRKIDKVIIDAVTATVVTGATGTSTSAYDTTDPTVAGVGNQIAVAASGLIIDKMRHARKIFEQREVGLDDMEAGMAPFTWVTDPGGHEDLLEQTEATSTDYIGVQIVNGSMVSSRMPLVEGRIPYYMGFRIKISNQLNTTSGNIINLAWHKNAMAFATWGGRLVWVGDLPEHNMARGIIIKEHFGAARVQDAGVLSIVCQP